MFERIYYDDNDIEETNFLNFTDKMIKVVVKNKSNQLQFDKFVEGIVKSNCLDLKIIETAEIYDENIESYDDSIEDTLTILNKYVEESEMSTDKNIIKKILQETYKEALELR
jgi:hypothetical protein